MLTKFWEGVGDKLAEQLTIRVLTPAFAFWAGGLAAWVWSHLGDDIRSSGWIATLESTAHGLQGLPGLLQAVLVVVTLLLLAASAVIADRLTLPVLRLLEGYWPNSLGKRLSQRNFHKRQDRYQQATALAAALDGSSPDSARAARLARLEEQLRGTPATLAITMPTRLGNLLRSAEARPRLKYGLDPVVCWPHMWLLLDKETKDELVQARAALNDAARAWLWGLLFVVWTAWGWWALPVGIIVSASTYYLAMLSAAQVYGDLLEAVFDLHRVKLYQALRWPLPSSPDEETANGEKVTTYLWRGLSPSGFCFERPTSKP